MADQVRRIAIEFGVELDQRVFTPGVAVAADERAARGRTRGRRETDARAGLLHERTVRLEQIVAGERPALRIAAACARRAAEGDEAAIGDRAGATVVEELVVGRPGRVRTAGRVHQHEAVAAGIVRTVRSVEAVLPRIFEIDRDVAAAVGEILAGEQAAIIGSGIAVRGDVTLAANLQTFEMILEDEVHDASDRVRTIDCRAAAGDDVDTLDQVARDGVDVGRDRVVEHVRSDVTAAVDEDQRALRTQAVEIDQVEAGGAEETSRVCLAERVGSAGQLVEHFTDVGRAGLQQFGSADRVDRNRGRAVRIADARSGDDDLAGRVVGSGWLGGRRDAAGRWRGVLCDR